MEETKTKITIETTVNAPVEKVWKSWTKPEHITKWCQATDEWHAPYADNDLQKGGKFKTTMAAKDGSMGFDFEGIYDNVEEYKMIDYTLADGRQVNIIFTGDDDSTDIVQTFEAEETNSVDLQRSGWQAILDNFKKYTEENL